MRETAEYEGVEYPLVEYDGHLSILIPTGETVEVRKRKRLTPWRVTRTLVPQQAHITVCAECENVRSILFLFQNRWLCTNCREQLDPDYSTQRGKTGNG